MPAYSNAQQVMNPPTSNLAEQAHERIVDMILNGELPAGSLLQERKLADFLNISRTPVREALMRLAAEGLVARAQGRAVTVGQIHEAEMMEILHVRSLLETEAVELAIPRVNEREIDDLKTKVAHLMAHDTVSVEEHASVDDQLHGLIADQSENKTLAKIISDLRRKTRFFNTERVPARFHPGNHEHLEILSALEKRDAKAARDAISQHIENTKQGILERLQRVGGER